VWREGLGGRRADAVLARNGVVKDIFVLPDGRSSLKPHSMTPFARVEDGRLFYPPATIG
jgi:hypothetical protein